MALFLPVVFFITIEPWVSSTIFFKKNHWFIWQRRNLIFSSCTKQALRLTTTKNIEEFDSFALVFNFYRHRAASTSKHPLVRQLEGSSGTICHYGSGLPRYCWEDDASIPTSEIEPLTFTSVKNRTTFVKGPLNPRIRNKCLWTWFLNSNYTMFWLSEVCSSVRWEPDPMWPTLTPWEKNLCRTNCTCFLFCIYCKSLPSLSDKLHCSVEICWITPVTCAQMPV